MHYFIAMSRAHSQTFPSLHLRHNSFSNPSVVLPTSQFIIQPFSHFTYATTHSPTLPSLYLCHSLSPTFLSLHLRHNSFSNPSVILPTSQLILQLPFLHLRHSSFSNPSFVSPTSQALHLIHLASPPCFR